VKAVSVTLTYKEGGFEIAPVTRRGRRGCAHEAPPWPWLDVFRIRRIGIRGKGLARTLVLFKSFGFARHTVKTVLF